MVTCRPYHFGGSFLVPKTGRNDPTQNDSSFMTAPFPSFPKIKFCASHVRGSTAAIDLGVDAVGFNFYPKAHASCPCLKLSSLHASRRIVSAIGIFVNSTPQHVAELVAQCPLDGIQLHGEEDVHWLTNASAFERLRDMPVVRSIAWRGAEFPEDEQCAVNWVQSNVSALLVDAQRSCSTRRYRQNG